MSYFKLVDNQAMNYIKQWNYINDMVGTTKFYKNE